MSGIDPSRLANDLRSSLAGLQQGLGSRGRVGTFQGLPWEEWLSRESSTLDETESEDDLYWPLPPAARSLPELLQSLAPQSPSRSWTDALTALKGWGGSARSVGGTGAASGRPYSQPSEGLVPNQFDPSLSPQEAKAACGPAAAVALARANGRNLSLREVVDLAKTVGWTPVGGMNGVANQKRLLEKIGVPVRLDISGDWNKIAEVASSGQPITISTPGHYFVADGYDPKTGRFHLGASGTAYRNGKEWMTRQEIEGLAGRVNGTLVMDAQRRWRA